MNKRILFVCGLILTGCAAHAPDRLGSAAEDKARSTAAPVPADTAPAKRMDLASMQVAIDGEPFQGDEGASLTLVGFHDFQCFYCAHFAANTLPQLEREYIRTGWVKYVFRDLPREETHPKSLKAGVAAHCAGEQQKFWPMHNLLFAGPNRLETEDLLRHAQTLGLNESKFRNCLENGGHEAGIRRDVADGTGLGVQVTPTFYLGFTPKSGKPMQVKAMLAGSQPYALFKQVIDDLLRQLDKGARRDP